MDWAIKVENLTKRYKNTEKNSVDSVDFEIKKGSAFGLLGPNGAGKTTIFSILCGLMDQSGGQIKFKDSENQKEIIGYVPQDLALYLRLTAKENILFFGRLYGINKKELEKRTEHLLSLVGLQDRANDFVKKFSTGMKRRLNLAIGLINNPKIILLDEPTVGIDPQSRNCIFDLLLDLKKKGSTILYTTHYMEEADKLCDTVAIMDLGKILIEGNPKKLVENHGFHRLIFKIESKIKKELSESLLKSKSIHNINIQGNELEVTSENIKNNMEILEEINKISKKSNVEISLLKIIEPNLESLFLDITGRTLRDSAEEENLSNFR